MKGYVVPYGYMGFLNGTYVLFATENEYKEEINMENNSRYMVILSATYEVEAKDRNEAVEKALEMANVEDLGCGWSDVEELD